MACGQPAYTVDVSIACSFMILQAYELGLGTCWIGAFEEDEVKKILEIPKEVRAVAMTPLGNPSEPPSQKFRKSLNEIVCYEKYE
jgi:nitroreductase